MAEKNCPICEIFTSSSSTTLNSHIDQCLSGVSMITWKAKSKASKHRIEKRKRKRKMRSMVDIYARAPYCTLEELASRNGTNWASNLSLPAQEIETCAEERKQDDPLNIKDMAKEDSVHLNANGTKLQTFTKFTDHSSPEKIGEHPRPRRLVKGDQGSKVLLMHGKKKKKHGKEQHKLQKSALDSKKLCSPRPQHKSEIIGGQEQDKASKEICEEEEVFTQHRKTRDQVKFNDERTGLKKKLNFKNGPQSRGERNESSLGDSCIVKRSRFLRSPKSSGTPPSPPNDCGEELYLRKRARVSTTCNEANPVSSTRSPRVDMKSSLTKDGDRCVKSKQFSSKNKSLSSLRKKLVSVSRPSVPEPKLSSKRICSPHQKTRERLASELDEEATANYSVKNRSKVNATSDKNCDNTIVFKNTTLKVRKDRGSKISKKDEAVVLKGSKLVPGGCEHDDDDKVDLVMGNIVSESASGMVDEEALMRKPLDGGFHDVTGFSNGQSDSRGFVKVHKGPCLETECSKCPVELITSGGQKMFCIGGGETNLGENVRIRTELDSYDDGPGNDYIKVDSITIPGPPGSFLPSPCRKTSGNSSLISSLVQSSEDHHGYPDVDHVDSPSATSTIISNSDVAKSDSRFCRKLPLGPHGVEKDISLTVSVTTVDAATGSNSQEAPILWPRTLSLMPQSVSDKHLDILNVNTYPLGHFQNENSANSEIKVPSKSNSVVRLMGKEIVVLKKDDNPLPELGPSQSPTMNSQGNPRSYTISDVYSGNVQNKGPVESQGLVFRPVQQNSATGDVNVTLSNCYYGAPERPSWHVNPIQHFHQPNATFLYGGSPPLQSPNLRTPPSSGVSSSHTMWNCVPLPPNGSFTSFTPPTYI